MKKLLALFMLLTVAEGRSDSAASAMVGQTVTLTVTADGTPPLTFAWFKNGLVIPAAISPTLLLSPLAKTDSGVYSAQVANAAGFTLSDNASITVTPMLATLTANVTSANYPGPTLYAWRLNGKTIPGANQSTYVFDPALAPGSYSVSVTWPNIITPVPALATQAK